MVVSTVFVIRCALLMLALAISAAPTNACVTALQDAQPSVLSWQLSASAEPALVSVQLISLAAQVTAVNIGRNAAHVVHPCQT